VRIDSETQRTVLQYRDGSDGKVVVQYPSEKQLEAYRSKATAERAKEQEKEQARITGEDTAPDTGTSQTGIGKQAGSPIAGQSTIEGESAGGKPSASTATQSPPISIPVSTPRAAAASAPVYSGSATSGTAQPALQSISA
jgi:hypothetical protein